jgi:hypothetical protein
MLKILKCTGDGRLPAKSGSAQTPWEPITPISSLDFHQDRWPVTLAFPIPKSSCGIWSSTIAGWMKQETVSIKDSR